MKEKYEQTVATTTGTSCMSNIIVAPSSKSNTPCSMGDGHTWTFGGRCDAQSLEGVLCDCGTKRYESPKFCKECGHQL